MAATGLFTKHKSSLEKINQFGKNTLSEHLGIVFTKVEDDYLEATMPVDHRTHQPAGLLHGGASVALAETMGSVASALVLDLQTHSLVGIEINANHIRGVREGHVLARVRAIHIGRTTHVWDIQIFNTEQKLVCISRLTCAVLDRTAKK